MAITFPTSPVEGQTFTDNNVVYRYSASRGYWTTISLSSITLTQLQKESFVATEGQTVHTFNYDPGAEIQVVMNGIILRETDYTATNGTSITFTEAFVAGDQVDIFFYPVAVVVAPTSINNLTDVTITSATTNETLVYNGSQWVNETPGSSGSSGSSVTSYVNFAAFPSSNNSTGDLAFAENTKYLYVWDGVVWDQLVTNATNSPQIVTSLPASLILGISETTDLFFEASDPSGFPITYSYDTVPSDVSNLVASVATNAGTFSVTTTSTSGDFVFRAKATDGIYTVSSNSNVSVVPTAKILTNISPPLPGGETTWDFDVDGPEINLSSANTYTFTAAGYFTIDFEIFGAGGGSSNYNYGQKGGPGGRTTGRFAFSYNENYTMIVGGKGRSGGIAVSGGSQGSGGNGGGANGYANGGGADLSGLFIGTGNISTFALDGYNGTAHTPIAIAGGGGGCGGSGPGGFGGGLAGGDGASAGTDAGGGTQLTGGIGGIGGSGTGAPGTYLKGGVGAPPNGTYSGSGGGGGYFGGGGSGHTSTQDAASAAGGSGYFNPSLVSNGSTIPGVVNTVLPYLNGNSQTSGKGGDNSDNATDGRIKLTKIV